MTELISCRLRHWLVVGVMGLAPVVANAQEVRDVNYSRDVQPILAKHCYACHGPDDAEGGLRLSVEDSALAKLKSGAVAVVPGNPAKSELIHRVKHADPEHRMPAESDPLSATDIKILTAWIQQGAQWSDHWGFRPLSDPSPPVVSNQEWSKHPVDAFVYRGLAAAKLEPNPVADRRALIRRAAYDLTGLPPSADEVDAFVKDTSPDAFEKQVDRMLDSHHYGERWARHWLDLVRFAETNSYERDGPKPNAWKYRDYVIKSFNDDKPFDQFTREQLAGDELPNKSAESITATGFYRLGIWDDEPVDRLIARYDELDDIVTTIGQVFLGVTINCARCHDHKVDPITRDDYYSMVAMVSDIAPYDRGGQNISTDVSSDELRDRYAMLNQSIAELDRKAKEVEQRGIVKMPAPDQRASEGRGRNKVLQKIKDYLSDEDWKLLRSIRKQWSDSRKELKTLPARETVLSVAKANPNPPQMFVMYRGNPHVPTDPVTPGFIKIFADEKPELPKPKQGAKTSGRRSILADWIASPKNPMTARVLANRIWQFHFGRGIVRSANNFGQIGTPPTHPELLDWLANRIIDSGWRLKPIHKLIMTSRTYRLASTMSDASYAKDPDNDLFWRYDMRRLSAEEVRDSLLVASGSLNRKPYGPSFYEKLSKEVLASQSQPGKGWGNSSVEDRNRRSVYIHVKRSLITPVLSAFDFPDPDRSCEARFSTLQPGQALTLLNSEFVHEQADRVVAVVKRETEQTKDEIKTPTRIAVAVRMVLGRDATEEEIAEGQALINDMVSKHQQSKDEALRLFCLSLLNWNEFVFVD